VVDETLLAKFVIAADATIETALAAIEANMHRSVIVVDAGGTVVGTLSDGDIRKALLNHRLLSTPVQEVMNLNFVWLPPEEASRAPELFQRHRIFLIPVLGPRNKLVDVLRTY
jgi:CBS domain-containing protein